MSALIRLLFTAGSHLAAGRLRHAGPHSPTTLRPFSTDGCSLFPDRSADGKKDWHCCCVQHDRRYWRGGPASLRLQADEELRACVATTTGDMGLARVMYAGVRVGGSSPLADELSLGLWLGLWAGHAPLTEGEQRRRIGWRGSTLGRRGLGAAQARSLASRRPKQVHRHHVAQRSGARGGADSGPRACSDDH